MKRKIWGTVCEFKQIDKDIHFYVNGKYMDIWRNVKLSEVDSIIQNWR